MLTADHPNALWIAGLYNGMLAIESDAVTDRTEKERRTGDLLAEYGRRMSPDLIIHTGGVTLATTGDMAFMRQYGRKRSTLSDSSGPVVIDQILADDFYGIVHGTFRTTRGEEVWERIGMGAWRFEEGMAMEHWELPNGPAWDKFYLAGRAQEVASAADFWRMDQERA